MFRLIGIVMLCNLCCAGELTWGQDFVEPKRPMVVENAPSDKVTNGHVYECGTLDLPEKRELVLPNMAVVEEYDGESVRFFVTKSMHCVGHPPSEMRLGDARKYFGIAYQAKGETYHVSTYGEWGNRGGSAKLKMLVLVPRGQSFRQSSDLEGGESAASCELDFDDPSLEKCYWYAGIGAGEDWTPIELQLNYNRFVAPD